MGKKYASRKAAEIDSYFKDEEVFEKQFNDELEDMDVNATEIGDDEVLTKDMEKLEEGRNLLLHEVTTLGNGEERTRAIGDLKELEVIMFARRRYERKKEKMSEEIRLEEQKMLNEFECKKKELEQEKEKMERELALKREEITQNREMHEEEIKVQKRGTLIGALVNVVSTIFMMGAYNFLLDKQNNFESSDNYSTSGSRGLVNNIASIPRTFGKR